MNWEEYQNSDWYKESHPDWDRKPTEEELKETQMREYIGYVDSHRERMRKMQERFVTQYDEDYDDYTEYDESGKPIGKATYICERIRNGRVYGLLSCGSYEAMCMRRYEFNLANLHNEWEWAGVERITYTDDDELQEILNGYREIDYFDPYFDDCDYDY